TKLVYARARQLVSEANGPALTPRAGDSLPSAVPRTPFTGQVFTRKEQNIPRDSVNARELILWETTYSGPSVESDGREEHRHNGCSIQVSGHHRQEPGHPVTAADSLYPYTAHRLVLEHNVSDSGYRGRRCLPGVRAAHGAGHRGVPADGQDRSGWRSDFHFRCSEKGNRKILEHPCSRHPGRPVRDSGHNRTHRPGDHHSDLVRLHDSRDNAGEQGSHGRDVGEQGVRARQEDEHLPDDSRSRGGLPCCVWDSAGSVVGVTGRRTASKRPAHDTP